MSLFLKVKKKGQDDSEARTMTRKSFESGASRRGWVIVSEIVNEKPKSQVQELMDQKRAEKAASDALSGTIAASDAVSVTTSEQKEPAKRGPKPKPATV
jgi:hypothetical protein